MARIAGIVLPDNKRVEAGLTSIFGIGIKISQRILAETKIDPDVRIKDLTQEQVEKLRLVIETKYKVEGDLKSEIAQNIKRLKDIFSYRGSRHAKKLPLRGQRTKTNSRTKRGKKVTVGSGRKKSADKT